MGEVKFMPSGDRAMVVEFGNAIDTRINDQVHTLARRIEEEQIPGIVELVPTFRSLMVYYDPFLTSYAKLKAVLENSGEIGAGSGEKKKRILKIPCCYGARFGQDLADMEAYTGLDRDEIIAIHSSVDYKIYMMGFLPEAENSAGENSAGSSRDRGKSNRCVSAGIAGRLAPDGRHSGGFLRS